ncbi:MAG TPA: hypothetical protein VGL09_14065 [Methylomirabilota bacterium]|jgi:hypothetical protein
MTSLRRNYAPRFGRQARFNLAVLVTVVVVAYVAVPPVVRWSESLSGYNPARYEPKDADRESWVRHRDVGPLPGISMDSLVYLGLFLLLAAVWLPLVSGRTGSRRRAPPR